jgi:peroxiredoxin
MDFDVVEVDAPDALGQGDRAPDFTRPLVTGEFWEDRSLSSLTDEGAVLLVFHPMDGAFPATYLWNELRDRGWEDDYDVRVVGLSISDPYAHKRLIEERGMEHSLFSDPGNGVARDFGIAHDLDGMAGVEEPLPAAYLLSTDRTVEYAWVAGEWPEFPDYDELEAALDER